jgi:tRNA nucleotidyltransferase (CCA-adding enzyme)
VGTKVSSFCALKISHVWIVAANQEFRMNTTAGYKFTQERWEHFDHKADVGVRGFGATKEAAFEQVALAATAVMTDPNLVGTDEIVPIFCEAPDDELLLADWLNALVFEMAHRKMIFGYFKVSINGHRLSGSAWGEKVDACRHEPATEIKGATYTELRVKCEEDGSWVAQCVLDV